MVGTSILGSWNSHWTELWSCDDFLIISTDHLNRTSLFWTLDGDVAILVSNPGLGNNVCGNMYFFMGKSTRNRKITIFYMGKSTFSMFTLKGIQFSNPPLKNGHRKIPIPWDLREIHRSHQYSLAALPLSRWTPAEPLLNPWVAGVVIHYIIYHYNYIHYI